MRTPVALLLLALAVHLVSAKREFVQLRSGRVDFRPPGEFSMSGDVAGGSGVSSSSGSTTTTTTTTTTTSTTTTTTTTTSSSYGTSVDSADPGVSSATAAAVTRATAVGGVGGAADAPQLYLMGFKGGASGGAELRADLEAAGGRVVSYIPDATLLVFATTRAAVAVAGRHGALMAAYGQEHKVSPEAVTTVQAASPARRRRRLQMSAGTDDSGRQPDRHDMGGFERGEGTRPEDSEDLESDPWVSGHPDSHSAAPAAAALRHLRTWRPYGPSPRADQPTRFTSPSAFNGWPAAAAKGSDAAATAAAETRRRSALQAGPAGPTGMASAAGVYGDGGLQADAAREAASGAAAAAAAGAPTAPVVGDPDLYGIQVHLVPGLSDAAREEALQRWPAAVAQQALRRVDPFDPCWPRAEGTGLSGSHSVWLVLYLCAEDIEDGVAWLSQLPTVSWIAPDLAHALHNDAAGWIIQTGNLTKDRFNRPTATLRPYWQAGIRGEGVLVGLGDTGLDFTHCHFLDERYDTETLKASLDGSPLSWTLDHRKVAQYVVTSSSAFFGDQPGGHGTHVAGSVAGAVSTFDDTAASTGAAPLARLSFVDAAPPNSSLLTVPSPYDTNYLPLHYRVGAKISSESWGSAGAEAVVYDSSAQSFDAFAWRTPDFLSVIAAGNAGQNGGMVTVCTPSTAKNALTVGATVNHPKEINTFGDQYALIFMYRDATGSYQYSTIWPQAGTGINGWYTLLSGKVIPLVLANPRGACGGLVGSYGRSIVLVDLGDSDCSYDTRANNTQAAGAAAAVYVRQDGRFASEVLAAIPSKITYTVITRAQGQWLARVITNSSNSKFAMNFWYYPTVAMGIDSVASFSSYGPLADGRIKPDLVAPGLMVRSANASAALQANVTRDTCSGGLQYMSGTSMATPLVSGHMALMQQYFRDGFYPVGDPASVESAGFEPSGMLLKAAAIVGATSLEGGVAWQTGAKLGAAPDGFQGWGRMNMAGALPLRGLTGPHFRLQVADLGSIVDGEEIVLHGIRATGTGLIRAALVWYDYPAALQATEALVNDLDLLVRVNGGPLRTEREDHVNTVERVEFPSPVDGDNITLVVRGARIVHVLMSGPDTELPQRWALAVAGDFRGVLRTQLNPTFARPQRLPASAGRAGAAIRVAVLLPGGKCLAADGGTLLVASDRCSAPLSLDFYFYFYEEKDNATGGYLYTARDGAGGCATFGGDPPVVRLSACDPGSAAQRLALFRNPHTDP